MADDLGLLKIGTSLEKIALELSLFRISYDTENTRKKIDSTFKNSSFTEEVEKNDKKVQKNIDDWRDYLHKYSLVLLSLGGFFLTMVTIWSEKIALDMVSLGFIWLGSSITVTFLSIFATIFLQRAILDGNFAFSQWCGPPNDEHPDEAHWSDAVRRNLQETIQKNILKLKEGNLGKAEAISLRKTIKADAKHLRSMKYCGGTYLWLERVRLLLTVVIVITSFAGIYILGNSLIDANSLSPENPEDPLIQVDKLDVNFKNN